MLYYKRIVTEFLDENAYILYNDHHDCIIIDPGFGFDLINSFITSNNLKPLAILATHAHFDHIASASKFIKEYNIDLYLCEHERLIIENFQKAANFWGVADIAGESPRVSYWINKDEMNYLINEFENSGMRGPLNRYRAQRIDFEELKDFRDKKLKQPAALMVGSLDPVNFCLLYTS